jgi:DNA helicase-2/ATP-dependent DNA helicase PcrA
VVVVVEKKEMGMDTTFAPSRYQQAIFDFIKTGTGNAVVEAVAGSGKTTTLIQAMRLIRAEQPEKRVLFCAFNRHIAEELATKAPAGASVSTIHSLGFGAVKRGLGRVEVNANKLRDIVVRVMGDEFDAREARTAAARLASLAKMTLTDPADAAAVEALMERYDIDGNGDTAWIVETIPAILDLCVEGAKDGVVDFDDMVWLPSRLDLAPEKYGWVLVDEAQDLNAAQRSLVLKAVAAGGRVIAVGDSRQAIYGFAGADTRSIQTITEVLAAQTLPLSICYRCPASHVAIAKRIVPQIEARPDAPKGEIVEMGLAEAARKLEEGDLVICRVNAPLVEIALSLIRRGQRACLRGRDLSGNLLSLVRRAGRGSGDNIAKFLAKLAAYRTLEADKLRKAEKEAQALAIEDKCDTLIALADGLQTVKGLEDRISSIFSDGGGAGVICSSVHRAKGLEARRVLIVSPSLMPHPRAQGAEQVEQEMNLKYVALTRAKETLWLAEK